MKLPDKKVPSRRALFFPELRSFYFFWNGTLWNGTRRQTVSSAASFGRNGTLLKQRKFQTMDQRDQELLDKQLRHLNPYPRSDSVMMLAILAVFFAGMALGSFLFAYEGQPLQIASNDAMTATSVPNGTPPTTLR
jgi:hypothetical protein